MNFIIIVIISAVMQLFMPWWIVAVVPFAVYFWRPGNSPFLASFAAIAFVWLAYGFYLHLISDGAMSNRIAEILSLSNGYILLLVTALIGGLVGGLSGLSGFLIKGLLPGRLPHASSRN
ncbi:hypothetical protein [Dyadobacter sediminis]|uniref:Uncharacterized protein n=1 Tax=Dyadobacter sediminis TaxID=1493691 RepID=A0A5R9K5S8_9BACT|nr:hypothetical protein [Dyadobacter sediminis]TLU89027.1 hypothetical protein FEM55_23350 [Dyadobacter sediminis]GGC03468.1 hypothetical protein GCM10011325_33090 [Dyadobacter sediminis]